MKKRYKKLSWLMVLLMVLQLIILPGVAGAAPAAPTDVRAVAADDGSKIIIMWSGSTSLKYNLYRSTDSVNFNKITASPVEGTRYDDTGLNRAVTYYYYVTAVNSLGEESSPSATVTPYKVQPPTNLRAVVSGGQITLSWTAPGGGTGGAGYNIYRKAGAGNYTKVNPSPVTAAGYTDTGLLPNTAYTYQVATVDTTGIESMERVQTTVITPADSQAPGRPDGLTAAASGLTRINLAWNAPIDNFGVTEYLIYRSTDNRVFNVIAKTANRNYSDTGLTINMLYYYRVSAKDAAGNESAPCDTVSARLVYDTEKPVSPKLWAGLESSNRIKLTWSGATDNTGVTGYELYRAVGSSSFSKIASPTSSPYYDNDISENKTYSYYIKARDAAGNISNASNTVIVTAAGDVTKTIDRGESGHLEISGVARLDVPSDALAKDTTFKMLMEDFSDYSDSDYKTIGQPVKITARTGGSEVSGFNDDLTVTMYYNSSQLGGSDVSKLHIYFWDEDNDVWAPMSSTPYWSPQKVTAKTDHLTVFALLADTHEPDEPTLNNSSNSTTRIVTLSGKAEAYTEVEIKLNGRSLFTTATGRGRFTQEVSLDPGTNYIELRAKDAAGNRSSWSHEYTIKYKPSLTLSDIDGHWAEDNIQKAVELGIASGYNDKNFRPDRTVTRAEFCRFLVSALGYSPVSNPKPAFKDYSKIPDWARGSVARAYEKGIVSGYSDGEFKPGRAITREEMASMLVRAMNLQREADAKNNSRVDFEDYRQIQKWSRGAVVVAVERGLIKGYTDNTFGPARKASRAEAVTMIVKMLDSINDD